MVSTAWRARLGVAAVAVVFFSSVGVLGWRAFQQQRPSTVPDVHRMVGSAETHGPEMIESTFTQPSAIH